MRKRSQYGEIEEGTEEDQTDEWKFGLTGLDTS